MMHSSSSATSVPGSTTPSSTKTKPHPPVSSPSSPSAYASASSTAATPTKAKPSISRQLHTPTSSSTSRQLNTPTSTSIPTIVKSNIPRRKPAAKSKSFSKHAAQPHPNPNPPPSPSPSSSSSRHHRTHMHAPAATPPATPPVKKALFTRQYKSQTSARKRQSTGPLSERTMSQIRCPTRVDFLNAVNGVAPSSPAFGSALALARSRSQQRQQQQQRKNVTPLKLSLDHQHNHQQQHKHQQHMLRTSRLTDDELKLNIDDAAYSTPPTSPDNNVDCKPLQLPSTISSPVSAQPPAPHAGATSSPTSSEANAMNALNTELNEKLVVSSTCAAASAPVSVPSSLRDGETGTGIDAHPEPAIISSPSTENTNFTPKLNDIDEENSDDDVGIPAYLNKLVLDAMDKISECDELKAIIAWMDVVRSEVGYTSCITDTDLTNGTALLQTLLSVAPEAFEKMSSPDGAVVRTQLDEQGSAAQHNVANVVAALYRFPWRDGANGRLLSPVAFERVDVWGLAGFIVLAAVTGRRCEVEVDRMLTLDEWAQDRLSDVVHSGLEALGATMTEEEEYEEEEEGKVSKEKGKNGRTTVSLVNEKRRREELEDEVEELMRLVENLQCERDEIVEELQQERTQANKLRRELSHIRKASIMGTGRKKKRGIVVVPGAAEQRPDRQVSGIGATTTNNHSTNTSNTNNVSSSSSGCVASNDENANPKVKDTKANSRLKQQRLQRHRAHMQTQRQKHNWSSSSSGASSSSSGANSKNNPKGTVQGKRTTLNAEKPKLGTPSDNIAFHAGSRRRNLA